MAMDKASSKNQCTICKPYLSSSCCLEEIIDIIFLVNFETYFLYSLLLHFALNFSTYDSFHYLVGSLKYSISYKNGFCKSLHILYNFNFKQGVRFDVFFMH